MADLELHTDFQVSYFTMLCLLLFRRAHRGFWNSKAHVDSYKKWLCVTLGIEEPSDWNDISKSQINALKGAALLKKSGGLSGLIWNITEGKFNQMSKRSRSSKVEKWIIKTLQRFFP